MYTPPGMTESQVIAIIYSVSGAVAPFYLFGYNALEDIVEDGVYECIKVLSEGKYTARSETDLDRQLYAFLRTHLHHRLYNNRRNKSCRYESPDSESNRAKYNIMHPLKIHSQGLVNSEIFSEENHDQALLDRQEEIVKLRRGLTGECLKLFVKHLEGVHLSPKCMETLAVACRKILLQEDSENSYAK